MPYKNTHDLPEGVRRHLPKHAQEIYRAVYNNAWHEYADPAKRRNDSSREEVAHQVAWAAVKKRYRKQGGHWVARPL